MDTSSLESRADDPPRRVVVVGSYGVGLTLVADRFPAAGETVVGRSFATGHGGKGSNQAVAAARLGATVTLCSAVGTDDFGERARGLWSMEGVDHHLVSTVDGSTMVGVILVDSSGENRIAIAPGVLDAFSADRLAGLDEVLVGADVLLVGLEIPVDTATAALRAGRVAGVTTVLNPAPAPDAFDPSVLELVDHLIPNRGEAARLSGGSVDDDPIDLIASPQFGLVPVVVLTLGGDGALVRNGDEITVITACTVPEVVDTTGAGDTFSAAYAVEVARGVDAVAAARFACRAAALCVTIAEVVPSLPTRSAVDRALSTGKASTQ